MGLCPGDGGKDGPLRSYVEGMTVTMQPSRTSGFVVDRFEDDDPNPETAQGADPIRLQVLGGVVLLCLVALLILGMREVDAIPTPSPLDARMELTTTIPDSVPSHLGGGGTPAG